MGKLVVIDSNSLMHRAFHAKLPPMYNRDGTPTKAIFGFLNMLMKIISTEKPTHLIAAFDAKGGTFRNETYAAYKGTRKATDEELIIQFPLIKEVLRAMGIAVCEQQGFEADDLLGIFSRRAEAEGLSVRLVTGDRDALQLVSEQTNVILTRKGISEIELFDNALILERYGILPTQMVEVKGLMGDSSDNIPGVPSVGEKTALKLILEFSTLEGVLEHIPSISSERLKAKLTEYADQARMSRELGRIITDPDSPISLTVAQSAFIEENMAGGRSLLQKLDMNSLLARLPVEQKSLEETETTQAIKIMTICTVDELKAAAAEWQKAEKIAFVWDDSLSVATCDALEYRVSLAQNLIDTGIDWEEAFAILAPVLSSQKPVKYLFDAKKWMHTLNVRGKKLAGLAFDAMIAAYLLNATSSGYELAQLAEECLGRRENGAAALFALCKELSARMAQKGLSELYNKVELPLIDVLFDMEREGFAVDDLVLRELNAQFSSRIDALAKEIYTHAGAEFSILSPKQLGTVLFETLALPVQRKIKTGFSTDADTLEALEDKHPIVPLILEYRQLTKLKSTYVDGLLAVRDATGRVHTTFNQTIAATGRISSTEPNLQNIPIRTELGREIRKAFVASEGNVLVGADYSQIELRVLAHISNDSEMQKAFREGEDIHTHTAAEVFDVEPVKVTSTMRSAAKAVNFGIVYGISDFGLARNLGIPRKQAGAYIAAYLEKYTGVANYMRTIVQQGKDDGFVTTMLGRRRDLPELLSHNFNTRSFGERVAMNTPIQGTAADIIKLAMVAVHNRLKERQLHAKLVLQVHDELIIDTPIAETEIVKALVTDCMEQVLQLSVPLVAEASSGRSWYDTK